MAVGFSGRVKVEGLFKGSTPAATETDPHWNDVILLIRANDTNDGYDDLSNEANAVTIAGTVPVNTTNKKFNKSIDLTVGGYNASNYLRWPNTQVMREILWSGNAMTMEAWVYLNSTTESHNFIIPAGNSVSSYYSTLIRHSGTSNDFAVSRNGGSYERFSGSTTFTTGTWYHVAITKDSSNDLRFYIDGNRVGNVENFAPANQTNTGESRLGRGYTASSSYRESNCLYEEVRVTDGVARYTGEIYDVPTGPFPTS